MLNPYTSRPRNVLYSQVTKQSTQLDSPNGPSLTLPPQQWSQQDQNSLGTTTSEYRVQDPSETATSISVSPLQLITFIVEVLQLATAPRKEEDIEAGLLDLVSEAASKYLGYTIDQNSIKGISTPVSNLDHE